MDLSWLNEPYRASELSQKARRGEEVARTLSRFYDGAFAEGIRVFAHRRGVSERTIRRWIAKARREVLREQRPCKVAGCPNALPRAATEGREYCEEHAAGDERVRRHRA